MDEQRTAQRLQKFTKLELIEWLTRLEASPPSEGDPNRREFLTYQLELEMQNRELQATHRALEESRGHYADLYESSPVGYCTVGKDGLIQELNTAAADIFKGSARHLRQQPLGLVAGFTQKSLYYRALARCLKTCETVQTELAVRRIGGPDRTYLVVLCPQTSERQEVVGVRITLTDVSEQKNAEARLQFLLQTSDALASSLELHETLSTIAQSAVPIMADICCIDEVSETGFTRSHVAFACIEQEKKLSQSTWTCSVKNLLGLAEGESWTHTPMIRHRPTTDLGSCGPDMLACDAHSVMVVPLTGRSGPIGALTFLSTKAHRRYKTDDLGLAQDIARRAALAMENAKMHSVAKKAVQAREKILGVVSHDLLGLLTILLLQAEALETDVETKDLRRMGLHIDRIQRAGGRMEYLIKDLLDIASIDAGHLTSQPERLSIRALLLDMADSMHAVASSKNVRLPVSDGVDAWVWCDRNRICQVLQNLLGNAIKFCPESGTVVARITQGDRHVTVSVIDEGPTIPEPTRARLFEPFWQAEATASLGAGLGLSIVRGIVGSWGGRVWVEPRGGQGNIFSFTVPLCVNLDRAVSSSCQQSHILVVEDDEATGLSLAELLRYEGYHVQVAANGQQALDSAAQCKPVVIFLDLNMPTMDGWEFLERRAQKVDLSAIPVVVTTGDNEKFEISSCKNTEMLSKPLCRATVVDAVRHAIDSADGAAAKCG